MKSAVLLVNLIKKHPFHNANKHTAFLAVYVFLKLNGYSLKIENQEFVEFIVRIATYRGEFDDLKEETTDIQKIIQQRSILKIETN
ncbi:type II toxin-antitoxin system death-on-curing family toxin [Enterococcus sp. DIV0179]|uniref:type II toxin-antitoxin system death-on-curing family toxin n=1 Tax=Enterococcus sp. DIV0179 TaxID=2774767 RepID=UPI003D301690